MFTTVVPIGFLSCCVIAGSSDGQAYDQDRPDCPGKIICPLTGDLVCKDRCPLGKNDAARKPLCCVADAPEVSPGMVSLHDEDGPISLRDTLEPLIDHFNSGQGKPRFVALLSSTCPACVFGAKAIRESVLKAYPDADLQVSIVWIDMLPSDNEKAATKSSGIFDDPRVKQFHDPDRKSGYAIAKDLLYENAGPAWDIYLYYDKNAQWADGPPKPMDWVHQLGGGRRADEARFTPGQKLVDSLHQLTGEATSRIANTAVATLTEPAKVKRVALDGAVLRIEGMICQGCVDVVQKAIVSVEGVTTADVDLDQGVAWATFRTPNAVQPDALVAAVTEAGFKARYLPEARVLTGDVGDSEDGSATLPSCATVARELPSLAETPDTETPLIPALVSLESSLQLVIDRFNADRDKPRIVALLSPTCGGCVHAARALQKEIIEQYPDEDLSLLIVWEPMLGSDDQPSAEKISNMFNDPRVTQYWDGQRLSGKTYSTQVYADRYRQVSQVTPDDHFLASMFKKMADRSPEQIPMWDFALFYRAGVIWKDVPPKAQGFIRQLAYSPGQNGSGSTFLVDDFSQPPIQSDWFDEVRREMRSLMSEDVTDAQSIGVESGVNLQFLSFPSCPNTPQLRQRLKTALGNLGIDLRVTEINLLELAKDDPRLRYGAPTILINGIDLLGQGPSEQPGLCCRIYADGGLPSVDILLQRLQDCYSTADDN